MTVARRSSVRDPSRNRLPLVAVHCRKPLPSIRKVASFPYRLGPISSHQLLSLSRSFFRFIGVRLDGTSHPSGSRSAVKLVFLCDPCPLLRTQKIFGSRPCPNRGLQIAWLLANPWGLTAWAVKMLMTFSDRDGTVDQSGFVVFYQPHPRFPVPAQILHPNNFSGRNGT